MALTEAERWHPPANVRAAGEAFQNRVRHAFGSRLTSDDPAAIQKTPVPSTAVLGRWITRRFDRVSSADAPRGRSQRAPTRNAAGAFRARDLHEEGRALDAMTRDIEQGTLLANLLVLKARALKVQYVLWRRTEWSSSRLGGAWEAYTGGDDHTNHVHLEVSPDGTSADEMARALAELDREIAEKGGGLLGVRNIVEGTPAPAGPSAKTLKTAAAVVATGVAVALATR